MQYYQEHINYTNHRWTNKLIFHLWPWGFLATDYSSKEDWGHFCVPRATFLKEQLCLTVSKASSHLFPCFLGPSWHPNSLHRYPMFPCYTSLLRCWKLGPPALSLVPFTWRNVSRKHKSSHVSCFLGHPGPSVERSCSRFLWVLEQGTGTFIESRFGRFIHCLTKNLYV